MTSTDLPSTFAVARPSGPMTSRVPRVWRTFVGMAGLLGIGLSGALSGCATTSGMAYNHSGRRAFKQGNYTAARREFEQAVAVAPDKADYAFNLAAAMHKQGDVSGAEQMYHRGISIDPSHQPSYHGLAKMLNEQGRTPEATQLLTAWTGSQPYSSEAHLEMAWLNETTGNLAGAEQSLQMARQISPRDSRVLAHMGQVYGRQGRTGEAMAMYDQAIGLNPMQPEYQALKTALHSQPGNFAGSGVSMAAADGQPTMRAAGLPSKVMTTPPMSMAAAGQFPQDGEIVSVTVDGKPVPLDSPLLKAQNVSFGSAPGTSPTATTWSTQPMPTLVANGEPVVTTEESTTAGMLPQNPPQLITPPPYQPGMTVAKPYSPIPGTPVQNASVPTVQAF